jgi:hypothetical protein
LWQLKKQGPKSSFSHGIAPWQLIWAPTSALDSADTGNRELRKRELDDQELEQECDKKEKKHGPK